MKATVLKRLNTGKHSGLYTMRTIILILMNVCISNIYSIKKRDKKPLGFNAIPVAKPYICN